MNPEVILVIGVTTFLPIAVLLIQLHRPPPLCECGRRMWFSAYDDGYHCGHGRHLRDSRPEIDP